MEIRCRRMDWEYRSPFRIAYRTETHAQTVLVELRDGDVSGHGEAMGVSYQGETPDTVLRQLLGLAGALEKSISRHELCGLLPAGGARNALDCALWDLQAKRERRRAWDLAGMSAVRPLTTAYTLGLDTPESTGRSAAAATSYSLLKLKLMGADDLERVAAVRRTRPDAELIVDANQSWNVRQLRDFVPRLADLGVRLIEQPMPVGGDAVLAGFASPIPLCADESCQTVEGLASLIGKYQYINIKLDKTGGLTDALHLARTAQAHGFRLMVGCMGGSSLAMAPAFVIGQLCDVVDLDGPLLLKSDIDHPIRYAGSQMYAPEEPLWG
ncbi:MAG TPA: N-acetyl-D-Glu racemase DgcA [Steroidobacteraceae bacterium]|nr:N-acetyl-D-Glu racemase DgcA [Steroidobacteraceae bacterium]